MYIRLAITAILTVSVAADVEKNKRTLRELKEASANVSRECVKELNVFTFGTVPCKERYLRVERAMKAESKVLEFIVAKKRDLGIKNKKLVKKFIKTLRMYEDLKKFENYKCSDKMDEYRVVLRRMQVMSFEMFEEKLIKHFKRYDDLFDELLDVKVGASFYANP
uniref:Uncharacterized protein n=1 Tax=Clastoptera arizonana TaxID=38151 RepID=A0A1B6E6Z5_9HEMI